MFYCETCRKEHKWPKGLSGFPTSQGACEMCRKVGECYDVPSAHLPPSKVEVEAKAAAKEAASKVTPADLDCCQSERPNGNTFMTFGGQPGLVRCRNSPIVIAREKFTHPKFGTIGEMSLCPHCMNVMVSQLGKDFVYFSAIEREGEDKGVRS